MRSFTSDLKIGFAALMVTFAVALVMIYITYEKYSLSRTFLGEAQKISATLPVLAVTEGQVAQWTEELRKNEVYKGEMETHLVEQINNIRLGKYTADALNEHLVSCQRFCGQLLNRIFVANMTEVAKLPHEVVFFDLDRDQVTPRYLKEVKEFAKKNNNQTLYLMGRASFIGGSGYNKELSGRRVRQIEKILRSCGLAEHQIKASWLGYEAPQLTMEIAKSYDIDPKEFKSDLYSLNQSVVLFTSTPGEYFPGVVNTMEKALDEKKGSKPPENNNREKPETVSQLPTKGSKKAVILASQFRALPILRVLGLRARKSAPEPDITCWRALLSSRATSGRVVRTLPAGTWSILQMQTRMVRRNCRSGFLPSAGYT